MRFTWTDELLRRAQTLRAEGYTFATIAGQLGTHAEVVKNKLRKRDQRKAARVGAEVPIERRNAQFLAALAAGARP
jgi:hypothetical protein